MTTRTRGAALALMAAGLLSACGGSQPQGPKVTDLGQQGFTLAPGTGAVLSISVPEAGTATATASWKNQATDVDLYWTDSACDSVEHLVLGSCHVLASGKTRALLNEIVSFDAAPGTYKLFALALGAEGDSGSVAFILRH